MGEREKRSAAAATAADVSFHLEHSRGRERLWRSAILYKKKK